MLGDLDGGGGRVQPTMSQQLGEIEKENGSTSAVVRNGVACLCVCRPQHGPCVIIAKNYNTAVQLYKCTGKLVSEDLKVECSLCFM